MELVGHDQADWTDVLGRRDRRHPRDRVRAAAWAAHAGRAEVASRGARRQHQRARVLEVLHRDYSTVIPGDLVLRLGSVSGHPESLQRV